MRTPSSSYRRLHTARRLAAVAWLAAGAPVAGQGQVAAPAPDSLIVSLNIDTTRYLPGNTAIEAALNRPLAEGEGDLVMMVGGTDVTAVSERTARSLTYRPTIASLPAGTPDVVIFLRRAGRWTRIHHATIKVLNAGGFQRVTATADATVGNKGQVASGQAGRPAPERATYQDFSLNGALGASHEHSRFTLESAANFVGVSRREEALRFSLTSRAPRLDLADYRTSLRSGPTTLTIGHTSFGNSRHLVNGFSARGANLAWQRSGTSVNLATLNATASVGWDRLLPVTDANHRLVAASIAQELAPRRPGMARVEATWLDASMRPTTSYTQGGIVDAEASAGGAVQLTLAAPDDRVRVSGALSRSRFANPARDGQLSGDSSLVPVEPESRTARYAEASVSPLREVAVPGLGVVNATLGARHERVDPLYRSVAAPVQADRKVDALDAAIGIGALSFQGTYERGRDNLGAVNTLLTTRTQTRMGNAALALARLLRVEKNAAWLPTMTYTLNRVHQLGEGVPAGGVFTPDQVPDQVSRVRDAGLLWQIGTWRLQARSSRAEQDNRQAGRVAADFASGADGLSVGWTFGSMGDLGIDVAEEFQLSRERNERTTTHRATLNANFRRGQSTSVVLALSLQRTKPPAGSAVLNGDQRIEVTQPLTFLRDRSGGSRGQMFLRFGRTTSRLPDFTRQALDPFAMRDERQWAVSSGLNLRMF